MPLVSFLLMCLCCCVFLVVLLLLCRCCVIKYLLYHFYCCVFIVASVLLCHSLNASCVIFIVVPFPPFLDTRLCPRRDAWSPVSPSATSFLTSALFYNSFFLSIFITFFSFNFIMFISIAKRCSYSLPTQRFPSHTLPYPHHL